MAKRRQTKTTQSQDNVMLARELMREMDGNREGTIDGTVIGVKAPLAIQFLVDSGVFPFGIHLNLNATKMSCKSMLVFEFGRLVKPYAGVLDYIVTEGKWSESLGYSVVGWGYEDRRVIRPRTVGDLDEMQKAVLDALTRAEKIATEGDKSKGIKPLGFHAAQVVAMDSISGVNTSGRNDDIMSNGHAKQDFAREALALTPFFRMVSNKMRNHPVILLTVNHRKEDPGQTQYSAPTVRQPGGKHLGFQATYDLFLKCKAHKRRLDNSPHGSLVREQNIIEIKCEKNSLGQKNRVIEVRVSWQDRVFTDPITGNLRVMRFTKWHWEEAIVNAIEKWLANKVNYGDAGDGAKRGVAGRAARLSEFFDFNRVNKKGIKYWSKTLGMTEDDAVTQSVFGRMIEESADAREAIAAAFGIRAGVEWDNNVDFLQFRENYQKTAADREMKNFAVGGELNGVFDESEFDPDEDDIKFSD